MLLPNGMCPYISLSDTCALPPTLLSYTAFPPPRHGTSSNLCLFVRINNISQDRLHIDILLAQGDPWPKFPLFPYPYRVPLGTSVFISTGQVQSQKYVSRPQTN